MNNKCIDKSLSQLKKTSTAPEIYRNKFNFIRNRYNDYTFIFTDGSKVTESITFCVTTENTTLKVGRLPNYSSIYTAEIIAILEALLLVKDKTEKYIVCTDSLAAVNSIENINNNNTYSKQIKKILINYFPKIILLWVPGHVNITGNEFADQIAKEAHMSPLLTTINNNYIDIIKYIKNCLSKDFHAIFNKTSPWYQRSNSNRNSITRTIVSTQSELKKLDLVKFLRIRLGHTRLTHKYLLDSTYSKLCSFCNYSTSASVEHILLNCQKFVYIRNIVFKNNNPLNLLSEPSNDNINTIIKFLKLSKLYYEI